jgi:hypothetical protein
MPARRPSGPHADWLHNWLGRGASQTASSQVGKTVRLRSVVRIDATLIRVLFVVLTLLGGAGPLIYLAMWIIVPQEP